MDKTMAKEQLVLQLWPGPQNPTYVCTTLTLLSKTGSHWVHAALSSCTQPAPQRMPQGKGSNPDGICLSQTTVAGTKYKRSKYKENVVLITRQRRKAPLISSHLSPRAALYKKGVMLQISNLHKSRAQQTLARSSTSVVFQTACFCWGPNFSHLLRWLWFYLRA